MIGQVDPNIKPTRKHEYTLGLDREMRARMSLGIRYAHKGWDNTIDDIGVCEKGSQVCGEVYGGPQHASISGSVGGQSVDLSIDRSDACGIQSWESLEWLLGPPER